MKDTRWGQFVRNKRKLRQITRRKLARLASIDPSYVTLIERDGYVPRKGKVMSLALALDTDEHECLLVAGYADEHIAKVYRTASKQLEVANG